MAIPAGLIARKFGYKVGILIGLVLIASGAFWFIPAINISAYWAFLLGLFIIATGMTCLETIANPYATVLGSPESGATRINMAQTINGCGWMLGAYLGGHYVFSGGESSTAATVTNVVAAAASNATPPSHAGLFIPYLGIGIFVSILLVVFIFSKVPDLRTEDESRKSAGQKINVIPSIGQIVAIGITLQIVCGVLYYFISRILELVWALLSMNPAWLQPTKIGLLFIGFNAAFFLVVKNWDMFRRKHFTLGIATQFFYVAAQSGIFGFLINYVMEVDPSVKELSAKNLLTIGFAIFTAGRLCGSAVMSQMKPHRLLAIFAIVNVVLTVVVMGGGKTGMYALFGTFFFMSIMFPTIFALGIRGLGDYTKLGSSLIVMSIVGGAIAPTFMGRIADNHGMRVGMSVPLVCFVLIALYGLVWQKLEAKDAGQPTA
jgi:FHS family L-fucose permease-like MFS transporter